MSDWHKAVVQLSASLREAMSAIENGALQIALVVDDAGRLRGIVTDGDVRRALIRGLGLDVSVDLACNASFLAAPVDMPRETRKAIMRGKAIKHLPLLDPEGRIVALETIQDLIAPRTFDNPVVVMAGGRGERLAPLTHDTPKPMLAVGGRPLLETIVCNFVNQGFRNLYLSVNYKAEVIESHFGDGTGFGAQIDYLREDRRLGTAGALGLLPDPPTVPVVITNGDILTTLNFPALLEFHEESGAAATMVVRDYTVQVPYGVIDITEGVVTAMREKPKHAWFVNAGIYVVGPAVLSRLTPGEEVDMPDLLQRVLDDSGRVAAYPLREYWIDVGRIEDFERARDEFHEVFS